MNQKSSNLPTLSVFVPIHRENETIERTILEIIGQNQGNFVFESIILWLDNSNDFCEKIARTYAEKDTRCMVKKNDTAMGVLSMLNQAFRECESDILIRIDSDTVYLSPTLFDSFTTEVLNGYGVIGTHYEHSKVPQTFLRCVDSYGFDVWEAIKWNSKKNTSIHKIIGSCVAYSKNTYKKIQVPDSREFIAEDTYISTRALELGHKITSVASCKAVTLEKIDSLAALINRYARHQYTSYKRFFDAKWLDEKKPELYAERAWYIFRAFFRHPIYISSYVLIVILATIQARLKKRSTRSW